MSEPARSESERIVSRQLRDLIAYLSRVQSLSRPTRDLIFLHSEAGAGADIEAATVDRLAQMARNGQTEGLEELLLSLPTATQQAAVATLARWVESFTLPLERENAVKVLLAAMSAVATLDEDTTALAAGIVLAAPGELPVGALADTVALMRRCRPAQQQLLVAQLRYRADLLDDPRVRQGLVAAAAELPPDTGLSGRALVRSMRERDEAAIQALSALETGPQTTVLKQAEVDVIKWSQDTVSPEEGDDVEPQEPTGATPTEGLTWALDQAQGTPVACTRIASWLLKLDSSDADAAVNARLDSLRPVQDEALTNGLLARARSRSPEEREIWLDALDVGSLGADAGAGIDAVAEVVWTEMTAAGAEGAEHTATLDHLAELHRGASDADIGRTQAAIAATLSEPMTDDAQAELRLLASTVAEEFVTRGLAERTGCADDFVRSSASALGGTLAAAPDQHPGLRRTVSVFLASWAEHSSAEALSELRDAAGQSADEPLDPTRAEALVIAVGELNKHGEVNVSPVAPADLGNLARSDGDAAAAAVVAWTRYFASDAQLWSVVAPMWTDGIPASMRRALGEAAKRLPDAEHRSVAESAIDASLADVLPPADSWEAIGFRDLKGQWVIQALVARIPQTPDDLDRWRRLLDICRQRAPGDRSKAQITNELLLPLARQGSDEAVDLVLDHLELVGRKNSEELLDGLSLSGDQAHRLEAKLNELGWKKGTLARLLGGLLGEPDDH